MRPSAHESVAVPVDCFPKAPVSYGRATVIRNLFAHVRKVIRFGSDWNTPNKRSSQNEMIRMEVHQNVLRKMRCRES
jgi:hypothetical protein